MKLTKKVGLHVQTHPFPLFMAQARIFSMDTPTCFKMFHVPLFLMVPSSFIKHGLLETPNIRPYIWLSPELLEPSISKLPSSRWPPVTGGPSWRVHSESASCQPAPANASRPVGFSTLLKGEREEPSENWVRDFFRTEASILKGKMAWVFNIHQILVEKGSGQTFHLWETVTNLWKDLAAAAISSSSHFFLWIMRPLNKPTQNK